MNDNFYENIVYVSLKLSKGCGFESAHIILHQTESNDIYIMLKI